MADVGNIPATAAAASATYDPETPVALRGGQGNAFVDHGPLYVQEQTVTGATNASPIVITTAGAQDLQTGDVVTISGVVGNTAANGTFAIIRVSATTFQLVGSTGNGAYVSGGTVRPIYQDCWVEGWAKAGPGGGYAASCGDAGGHMWIIGFGGNNAPANLIGSMWGGAGAGTWNLFNLQGAPIVNGEWFHWLIAVKSNVLRIFVNGVCCWQQTLSQLPRWCPPTTGAPNAMALGPADHLMWDGLIGWIRGFDSENKFPHPSTTNPAVAIIPDRSPRPFVLQNAASVKADWVWDYTSPQSVIVDHSANGRLGVKHPGVFMGVKDYSGGSRLNQAPMPQFEVATDSPLRRDIALTAVLSLGATAATPEAAPAGSRIWDSFGRSNQTYANGRAANLSLGSTESAVAVGGLAPQGWVQDIADSALVEDKIPFGLFKGAAVYLEARNNGVALVDGGAGSHNDQVSCEGFHYVDTGNLNTAGLGSVGVAFRGVDADNFRWAMLDRNTGYLLTGVWVNGNAQAVDGGAVSQVNNVNALVPPGTSNVLKVRPNGTTIEYYVGSTLVLTQTGQTTFQSATKCGLFAQFDNGVITSLPRWRRFRSGTNN